MRPRLCAVGDRPAGLAGATELRADSLSQRPKPRAAILLAPAACRRLDLQYRSLVASTSHLLPATARWPVETSYLATRLPTPPSTGSHLAGPPGGRACLPVLLLLADREDPSSLSSLSPGSFRSAHALHHLLLRTKIQYHDSWDKSFSCSIFLLLQELSQFFPSLATPFPISWNQWLLEDGRYALLYLLSFVFVLRVSRK